jgi:hypothetical protein
VPPTITAAGAWPERVDRLHAFFESWRSGDEYDREAITWVMACTSHFPGAFLQSERPMGQRHDGGDLLPRRLKSGQ